MDLERYLQEKRRIVDRALEQFLPKTETFPPIIHQAMRYSIFSGGKRLRPILTLASSEAVGGREEIALPFACAIEMIHTYSLIHDDLPPIDNADFRRGALTTHKIFGEDTAILAGDALLTKAFELMATPGLTPNLRHVLEIINEVAEACGSRGMIGGQSAEIEYKGKSIDLPLLEYIHSHKTGSLILTSIRIGAILGGGSFQEIEALSRYGKVLGLLYQITDDLLDLASEEDKTTTYPSLLVIKESKKRVKELTKEAIESLEILGENGKTLRLIVQYIKDRKG